MLKAGSLGIHPPGALGVAFFQHVGAECLIGRAGDGITDLLKKAGSLKLLADGRLELIDLEGRVFTNLLEAAARDRLPELLFVCCNPDQLVTLTEELVRFIENIAQRGMLSSIENVRSLVPILLILPNGIVAEQTVRTYEEQLHESRLMQRLSGVTEEMIAALLDRVVRGVSLQAGGRKGSGADTVYVLEPKGSLIFAGGGEAERKRIESILTSHGYPFKHESDVPGTRIEFDKAMISIVLNVGGLIHMVTPTGDLRDLRMGDLCKDDAKAEFVHRITRAVFDVGIAAGAYQADASYNDIWAGHRNTILRFAGHVTSSVKFFREAIARGLDGVKLLPNEEWILTPLATYAANASLTDDVALFKSLRRDVQSAIARAIEYARQQKNGAYSGATDMKLSAQRNITIELFDAGPENRVLIGTLLDQDHLIKLEINVYLPDEQITRSKVEMIRVPFPVCAEVASSADRLIGLRIERGILHEINQRLGGREGCSHIKELATNIIYFMASHLIRRRIGGDPDGMDFANKSADERFTLTKDLLRDSCLAYCQATPQALDDSLGIKRVGQERDNPLPLGEYDPSLGTLLANRAERWSDRTFIRYRIGSTEHTLTFSEFAAQTRQIARHLIDQGIQPGDRIAMLSENRVEMFLFELATICIGAVTIPIFAGYPARQVAYVLGHARPRFVVASAMHQLDKIEQDRHPKIEKYFVMDAESATEAWGAIDFSTLLQEGGASDQQYADRVEAVRPDDLCIVMYTSGTTGPPKGVKLSHRNIISQQKAIELIWDVDEKDSLMSYLPWHHSFGGLFERFMSLYHGCTLCIDDSRGRDMDRLIDNWTVFKPTLFFSVPRVHDLLMTRCRESQKVAAVVFGGRLRFVFTAGASLPAHVERAYQKVGIPVLEGWGLTETSPCVTVTRHEQKQKNGAVGNPIPGVTIRVDSDQEILVKGPNVMDGYLDDEEATSRVIDNDGWFHTGDLGELTADGLRLIGRKDGAFKLTTGEKVHPQRVEQVLVNESPYIASAVAVGQGEDQVCAILYPDLSRLREWASDKKIPEDQLLEHPAVSELFAAELERLNPLIEVKYQRVRRAILTHDQPSIESGELTPSGKLVRQAVLTNQRRNIDAMYALHPPAEVIEIAQPQSLRTP